MPRSRYARKNFAPALLAGLTVSAGLTLSGCQVEDGGNPAARPDANLATAAIVGGSNPVPGRIEAENYKTGGEGVGYHDKDAINHGGAYRNDGVDIKAATDAGGGYLVGWTEAGEWLDYGINVASAGAYKLTLRAASGSAGTKQVMITVDGFPRGFLSTTDASGSQSWKNIVLTGVGLPAGAHTLRIDSYTGKLNLNYLDLVQTSTANQAPVADIVWLPGGMVGNVITLDGSQSFDPDGRPSALTYAWTQVSGPAVSLIGATTVKPKFTPMLAGTYKFRLTVSDGALSASRDIEAEYKGLYIGATARIQAEDYGLVHELTRANLGGSDYRGDSVDVEVTTDAGGGYDVGYIDAGEWMEYPVHVATTGSYTLTARMASGQAGIKTMALSIDGGTGIPFSFTDASGWQSWKDVTVSGVNLAAGDHVVRLSMLTNGFNVNYVDVALGGPNLLVNGDFSNGLSGWTAGIDAPAAGAIANEAGAARISITNAGANEYDIELSQTVALAAGRSYTLEFDVKAQATPKNFKFLVEHNQEPYTNYVEQAKTVTVAANTYQHYTVTWTQSAADANAQVAFDFGAQNVNDLWIDNVTLR
jgi:hypothetical protein